MSRRIKIICVSAVIVVVMVGVLVWTGIARSGASELENWIGRQVVGALQSYVTPSIAFDDLHYNPPRGVTVEGLHFTAGESRILLIDRIALELAEIPRTGQPIKIAHVSLDRPQVRFITDARGELLGWSGFIRPDPLKDPSSVPQGQRFSDILMLRHVELHDGRVVYDPGDASGTVTIPGIELALDTPPAAQAGWYNLVGTFKRSPLLQAAFDARINLDTALLELKQLSLTGELGEKQYSTLPPPVQELLRRHQVQGTLAATLSGSVPITRMSASTVQWDASLRQARFAYGTAVLPVESLHTSGKYPTGPFSLAIDGLELDHENQPFVKVKQAAITVEHLPNEGKPLQIDRVSLEGLRVSLIGKTGDGFAGWSSLQQAQATIAPGIAAIRNVLRDVSIATLTLRDAGVRYQPSTSGRPIEVSGCDTELKTTRSADNRTLAVEAKLSRAPLVTAQLEGSIPLDNAPIDLTRLQLDLDLSPAAVQQLPDPLREAATARGLQGRVSLTAHGRIAPDNLPGSQIETEIAVTNARAGVGAAQFGAESAKLHVHLPAGDVSANTTGVVLRRGDLAFFSARETSLEASLGGGAALIIKRLAMTKPSFEFVREPSGRLAGWSALNSGGQRGPSIQVRQIELHEADVLYRASAQEPPTAVEGLDLSLALTPSADASSHAFTAKLSRKPLVDVSAAGTYNPVESILDLQQAQLTADMTEQNYAAVPARMRDTLQRYQLAGRIELSAHARIPLANPGQTRGEVRLDMTNGRMAIRQTTWPVQELHLKAGLPAGPVNVAARGVTALSGSVKFFSLQEFKLQMPQIPAPGRPFELHSLEVQGPSVLLRHNPDGQLAGWSNLFSSAPGGSATQPAAGLDRLAVLEEMQIKGGEVTYDPADGSPVMSLPGIDLVLHMPSISQVPDTHAFKGTIRRDPVLSVSFDGRVNLDEARLDLIDCQISADLGDREYGALPPVLQELLRKHEVQGDFDATFTGRIPLRDPLAMDTRFKVTLQNARVAFAETVWPLKRLEASGTVVRNRVDARYDASILDGTARGTANFGLRGDHPFNLTWQIDGARIESTLRVIAQTEPRYSGRLGSQGNLAGKADQLPATLSGQASLAVTDARLMRMPVIREILNLVSATRVGLNTSDSARVNVQFRPDRFTLSNLDVTSALVRLRGDGDVLYDGRISMNVTADLLQRVGKAVDRLPVLDKVQPLKRITGVIGNVTDRMMVYEVRGTMSAPSVRPRPLGLGK